jgi:peptidoglycan/LPS O-acetylase OafA/YrhL
MKFRHDINALRAIAVLAVIFYHFKVPGFTGGFLGVDIFFVISGYLMSKIILDGFDNDTFSLKAFYYRRVKRILPALVVLVIFVLIVGNLLFFPNELKLLSQYASTSLLFVSNIFYWLNSGYFDPVSKNNVLLHTWSLSVEWQFYMLYPLLLMLLKKLYVSKRKVFTGIIVSFIVLSYIATLIVFQQESIFAFYSLPTRAWEMVVGCAVLLFEKNGRNQISISIRNLICLSGYGIVILCICLFNEKTTWPSSYTGIPIIAAFVLLVCNCDFRFLRNPLIQFIGKISYSLYLWHWPLSVFATVLAFNKLKYAPVLFVLTFLLSYLSYRFIESNKKIRSPQRIILCSLIALAFAFSCYFLQVNRYFIDKNMIDLSDYQNNHQAELNAQMKRASCFITSTMVYENFSTTECLNLSESQENVLLIGDSHAAVLSASLKKKLTAQGKNFLQATTSSCPFFLNPVGRDENVKLVKQVLYEFIPQNYNEIGQIIISANWKDKPDEELQIKIPELIAYLQSFNVKVKIMGQTETYSMSYPSIAARQLLLNRNLDALYIENESREKNRFIKSLIPATIFVDVYEVKGLRKIDGYTPYLFDEDHLTEFGADQIIDYAENNGLFQ